MGTAWKARLLFSVNRCAPCAYNWQEVFYSIYLIYDNGHFKFGRQVSETLISNNTNTATLQKLVRFSNEQDHLRPGVGDES